MLHGGIVSPFSLTLALPNPLSSAHLQSDCAKSIKTVINLWIIAVWVTSLWKKGVQYISIKARRKDVCGDHPTETSLSAHHISQKRPFSTKRPPKAVSLSSILNIAEDKTEHAARAEWWYRRAFHCEFFIYSGWAWEQQWIWKEYQLYAWETSCRDFKTRALSACLYADDFESNFIPEYQCWQFLQSQVSAVNWNLCLVHISVSESIKLENTTRYITPANIGKTTHWYAEWLKEDSLKALIANIKYFT